ncbi:hypothetical protein C1646_667779 [Rhizophagus diaphanus]|nr:hypothetical protein C1646_667779 [Rhizophagus diaphanus] [Rhizophagus sp. MUCL 43196]
MEKIPPEIFLEICIHLYVKDLYTLTLVCKLYRKILWTKAVSIQKVWTCSRVLSFDPILPYPSLPPSKFMSEQEYIWFTLLADKCSICKIKIEKKDLFGCRYWEFSRFCCKECIERKTVSISYIKMTMPNLPKELLECLPYHKRDEKLYWSDDLHSIKTKYYSFENKQERDNWVKEKKEEVNEFMDEIYKYKWQDQYVYFFPYAFNVN